MAIETSQIKFAESEKTGELIGFVSRHSKTKKLKGVRENSTFGKKICVLSGDLKGTIIPNILYDVELKAMHRGNGYVVVSARPRQFKARIEKVTVPKAIYRLKVTFGNKTVYFDPKHGKSDSSRTLEGVLDILASRVDIEEPDSVLAEFKEEGIALIKQMEADGFLVPKSNKNQRK
ncbi:hypothetical protein [Dysgonomonas termitidis]|uniref:Uncharacterized protein n=1 Tax=Dysgonomonas termitidis TaxID=1516126 RepID=A0ABV9L4G0_9BACT